MRDPIIMALVVRAQTLTKHINLAKTRQRAKPDRGTTMFIRVQERKLIEVEKMLGLR